MTTHPHRTTLPPLLAVFALLLLPAAACAAPTASDLSFSGVTETSAVFAARVNPQNREVKDVHFQYITQADYEKDGNAFGAGTLTTPAQTIPTGTSPVAIQAAAADLIPGTAYRLRVYAKNSQGTVEGPEEAAFHTLAPVPSFDPCPNDPFRSAAALPDCRAYEQASPLDKNGSDAIGSPLLVKAALDGAAVSFGSNFGIPGGSGAQALPTYAASRAGDGWSTHGFFPPAALGAKATVLGWLPDFSASFAIATRLGTPRTQALYELHADSAPPTQIAPYTPVTSTVGLYRYIGASEDGEVVFFEATAALPPEEGEAPIAAARQGSPNLYAWDASSERLSLVSRLNSEAESAAALPKGAFAGAYDWARADLNSGGAGANQYTQEQRAVSAEGNSAYFTATGSGQLYERLNPIQPQSPLDGNGKCTDPELACTIHVSASEKTNGQSPDGTDPAGPAPAAFQAASSDGSVAFFTSSEKLTEDANTGPEQPLAQIGAATAGATEPEDKDESLLSAHALGLALSPDGHHVYWADPANHSIGRAEIDPLTGEASAPEPTFIVPGETECETFHKKEPGVLHSAPAAPRYVAVDAGHVYWTNTGPLGENTFSNGSGEEPVKGCGTIGRATIDPLTEEAEDVQPEFIAGAFNPQGIAVDSEHVYWANAATGTEGGGRSIGRAPIGGGTAEVLRSTNRAPYDVALDATHIYFAANEEGTKTGYLERTLLTGGSSEALFVGRPSTVRGVAIKAGTVYWANQGAGTIGRLPIDEFVPTSCESIPACEEKFIEVEGSPIGLAADPATSRLYWSVNGEAPLNPGNDLYRFDASAPAGSRLTDLSAETADEDGAEAVGVLGASADGSRLYFAANGVLAANEGAIGTQASPGDCRTPVPHDRILSLRGRCNLYLWREDPATYAATTTFIARLDAGSEGHVDKGNWVPGPLALFGAGSYWPKSAEASADGRTLVFRSTERLTAYDNHGVSELYRYREGDSPPLRCLSCNPTGQAPTVPRGPDLGETVIYNILFPNTSETAALDNRFLAAGGERVFFETPEALVGADTNGAGGCPLPPQGAPGIGTPACNDVYEWEAPGSGSCTTASTSYSPVDKGCIYLISTGKSPFASYFADASASGEDVFFFTREGLVGQDTDSLQDVYDARVGGGLAAQSPSRFEGCEGEACKGPLTAPPVSSQPATPEFHGPGNSKASSPCRKRGHRRKGRCHRSKPHKHRKHHQRSQR